MKTSFFVLVAIAVLGGCTFDDGKGFATLEAASLSAKFTPGRARDLGNGVVLTSQGYRVALTRAELGVEELALNELRGEAELAGGSARFEPVALLPAAREFDLLAGQTAALDLVVPSRELPQARITQLSLSLNRLELEGSVTGGPAGGGLGENSVALAVALPIRASINAGMSLLIDRDEPGAFSLAAALEIDGTLFDAIDFAAQASASQIEIVDLESAPGIALANSLLSNELSITIR